MADTHQIPSELLSTVHREQWADLAPVFLDTLGLVKMLGDTLTDKTVSQLGEKMEAASNLLDFLGDERILGLIQTLLEHSDHLILVLDQVMELEKNGTLDKLLRLAETMGILTDAITEETLVYTSRSALRLIELGDQAAQSPLVKEAPRFLGALQQTANEKNGNKQPFSLLGLLKLTKEREVQDAIHFGIRFLKNLQQTEKGSHRKDG